MSYKKTNFIYYIISSFLAQGMFFAIMHLMLFLLMNLAEFFCIDVCTFYRKMHV